MRPALAIFSLFLFCDVTPLNAQTFGLGGVTEYRPVRAQVFGLGEAAIKPRLTVRQSSTNKESLSVQPAPVVVSRPVTQPIAQPSTICIDGRCYPATQTQRVYQRQPLFRRWR